MPNFHLNPPDLLAKEIERFHWSYNRLSPNECWPWTVRPLSAKMGYGIFIQRRNGTKTRGDMAHRVQFFLHTGCWPSVVRHSCDNPPCVNPAHLLGGTQADNVQDCVSRKRNRSPKGTECHTAKLNEPQVVKIRKEWQGNGGNKSYRELSRAYGVSLYAIYAIVKRRTWKHVP